MIDFTGVQAIKIPEGNVQKIMRGDEVLWSAGKIPYEYQEVEYIEGDGNQYIITDWVPSEGTLFQIKFCCNTTCYPFGCGSYPRLACAYGVSHTQIYNTNNSVAGIYNFSEYKNGNEIEVETYSTNLTPDSYVILNGTKKSNNSTQIGMNFDSAYKMHLLAWKYNASTLRNGVGKLYYAKATVQGVCKLDMVPCYRKSDGVIGMYDLVSKQFYTNAGTGEFTKGADV